MKLPPPYPHDDVRPVDSVVWAARLRAMRVEVHDVAGALTGLAMMLDLWRSDDRFPEEMKDDLELMSQSSRRAETALEQLRRLYLPELVGPAGDLEGWWENAVPAFECVCPPPGGLTIALPASPVILEVDGEALRDACLVQLAWGLRSAGAEADVELGWEMDDGCLLWSWSWAQGETGGPEADGSAEVEWLEGFAAAHGGKIECSAASLSAVWRLPAKNA